MAALVPGIAVATSLSFTGTLATPESVFSASFQLMGTGPVSIQTWGFGGSGAGTNAAGQTIPPGGFDPLVALFAGTGGTASIVPIGGDPANPAGTSDTLSNFSAFMGCPPAGIVIIGTGAGAQVCGDVTIALTLAAGTYTLVLADANYQPNALIAPGASTLGDGFTDFTGGVFQTCNTTSDGTTCITPGTEFAVDVTAPAGTLTPTSTPAPPTALLVVVATAALGWPAWRIIHPQRRRP